MKVQVLKVLKADSFGRVELVSRDGVRQVRRVACGGKIPGSAIAARFLARREQRILRRLEHLEAVPRAFGERAGGIFYRSYIEGVPLYDAGRPEAIFFKRLTDLARAIHASGITHNDLAKEANVIVTPGGQPALVDFQLATRFPSHPGPLGRGLFAMLRREDLRHLLKHKRTYHPELLTADEVAALARKSLPVRFWSATLMKPYQRILCWFGLEPVRGPRGR